MTNPPISKDAEDKLLDEILDTKIPDNCGCMTTKGHYSICRKEAKASILSNFISRGELAEALKTPKGHIPGEECCDQCDLRASLRSKFGLEGK